jgi:hypothetical protein
MYIYIIIGILIGFALVAIGMSLWDLFFKEDEEIDEIEYFTLR